MNFDLTKLGVKKNIPEVNFTSYTGLFAAPPKFGKTTTASYFPNSIIVPFENGTKGQVANVVEDLKSWDDFIEFVDKLEENREEIGDAIETIVFDTVNQAWEMSETYALRKLSIADKKKYKKPNDIPHGGFYAPRDKFFKEQITRILDMGFAILFLTHSKVKTIRPKDEEPYDVYSSTMPERLEGIINPLVDFIIFGERRSIDGEPKRVLVTSGNDMSNAGNRVRLEEDIIFDSEEEAMEKYQDKFRETVEALLKKRGITQSYEEISKEQKQKKQEEIKAYMEKSKPSLESVIVSIGEEIENMTDEEKTKFKKLLKGEFDTLKYKSFEDIEQLQTTYELAKSVRK